VIIHRSQVLHAEGAREVYACATHAVFSPPATERLDSGVFQEVIVTNTIPVTPDQQFSCLTVLSVANLLGEVSRSFLCCNSGASTCAACWTALLPSTLHRLALLFLLAADLHIFLCCRRCGESSMHLLFRACSDSS
jgi:Phosphoribosyl synthetase-associated domain